MMNLIVPSIFVVATCVLMLAERLGAPVTPQLSFKGDLKRESHWFAQYGQGACSAVVSLVLWRLEPRRLENGLPLFVPLLVAVLLTGLLAVAIKRLVGRARPRREQAGQFLGPTFRHVAARESFPSSHTASAVAMTVVMAAFYPPAAPIFWTLAVICAALRYLMDAHWPSDVTAGFALGYGIGRLVLRLMPL